MIFSWEEFEVSQLNKNTDLSLDIFLFTDPIPGVNRPQNRAPRGGIHFARGLGHHNGGLAGQRHAGGHAGPQDIEGQEEAHYDVVDERRADDRFGRNTTPKTRR